MMKEKLFKKNRVLLTAVILSLAMILTGCGSKSETTQAFPTDSVALEKSGINYIASVTQDEAFDDSYATEEAFYGSSAPEDGLYTNSGVTRNPENTSASNRKLIRTVNLEVETTDFDTLLTSVNDDLAKVGGYIENEYTYNGSSFNDSSNTRNSSLVLRIPDDKLDDFIKNVSGYSNIISKSTSTNDVTLTYVDTESEKEMYKAELESLTALLEKAETVEDITYLTERVTSVRYQIESLESTLRTYDNLCSYATVNLNINEVNILTPVETVEKTDGERLSEGFKNSMTKVISSFKEFGINFVINIPYILKHVLILGIHALVIFLVTKGIIKKVKKNQAKKQAKYNSSATENTAENVSESKNSNTTDK